MKKTGIVGLLLDKLDSLKGQALIEQSGGNTGNIMFTHGVCTQVYKPEIIGYQFGAKSDLINSEFSGLVIPAANWIDANADWGFLADALENINIPICCVGLGSQIPVSRAKDIKPGTIRFLNLLSKKSALIGVRGEKTAEILAALGINNTVVCGCPSVYLNLAAMQIPSFPEKPQAKRISISFTRYTTKDPDLESQRPIARLAAQHANSIILQSEMIEARHIAGEKAQPSEEEWLSHYYDVSHTQLDELFSRMKIFPTHKNWIDFHKGNTDITVTSRIHGAIASFLAGKPAFVIAHDQRTSELSETMGIPNIPLKDLDTIEQLLDYDTQFSLYDKERLIERHRLNLELIKHVYSSCGITTCISSEE
jgi:polysaccharide pyruvyl transferase WcaK-like protein